ncbi:MAG TPA: hypothetical protein VL916_09890, partial [Ilumatobacteraceae bacterium]|nr:hypothetical protein [Ilumatobacteraceae bacterium]
MEEGSAPGRVEIELTQRESGRGRRRNQQVLDATAAKAVPNVEAAPGAPDVAFVPPPEAPPDRQTSERRRMIVTAVASGVVALFIGWALGRAGDGGGPNTGDVETGSTTPTTIAPTASPDELGETVAPV